MTAGSRLHGLQVPGRCPVNGPLGRLPAMRSLALPATADRTAARRNLTNTVQLVGFRTHFKSRHFHLFILIIQYVIETP